MANAINLSTTSWNKQDTVWMLSLYGTAIGAGILFLPIDAGMNGLLPLLIIALLAFPMTYFSHRALCRFVQSGNSENHDITDVVSEHFGQTAGHILTILYFFAIYPILLMYSVAITNTTQSFLVNQLGVAPPPRALLSIMLILALMSIVRFGQETIIKSMSLLVYPFITVLMILAIYLIPHWHSVTLSTTSVGPIKHNLLMSLWLIIPVVVFSFNHSPIISSFAVSQRQRYQNQADNKSLKILKRSHVLMVFTVLFFVFSCVFSLSPGELAEAKQQNISILSYLANHFHTPFIAYVAPFIAFIAIAKSFLGHYLGAKEGLHGIISKHLTATHIQKKHTHWLIDGFIVVTCWLIATLNPSILGMIESLGGPIIAIILFLMPIYAIYHIPAMQRHKSRWKDIFIILIGMIAMSAILYKLC